MIKLKDILTEGKLNERTGKTGIVTNERFYYHADERLTKIKELAGYLKFDVTKGKHTPEVHKKDSNLKKIFDSIDKLVDKAIKHFKPVSKNWKPSMEEGKLTEYRIRGYADNLVIRKGDIKKGMMVWFEDGRGSAKKLKVKHVMLSKDKKEEHYITNKGTFTPRDVVGY